MVTGRNRAGLREDTRVAAARQAASAFNMATVGDS